MNKVTLPTRGSARPLASTCSQSARLLINVLPRLTGRSAVNAVSQLILRMLILLKVGDLWHPHIV